MLTVKPSGKPRVGDIWLDRRGQHNLILRENPPDEFYSNLTFATLTLETGERWEYEELSSWTSKGPIGATGDYEKPFYHTRVA